MHKRDKTQGYVSCILKFIHSKLYYGEYLSVNETELLFLLFSHIVDMIISKKKFIFHTWDHPPSSDLGETLHISRHSYIIIIFREKI